jgi:hypothetical protein
VFLAVRQTACLLQKKEKNTMKATRAHLLGEFTGKLDGLIYYKSRRTGKLYVRRQWEFKHHPAHQEFGSAQKAIYAIQPSEGYKQNLKNYLYCYNNLPDRSNENCQTWTNIYAKLMFAMQKALPETVDLKYISRRQVEEQNLPCGTVKMAVEAGLLPVMKGYERLTAPI